MTIKKKLDAYFNNLLEELPNKVRDVSSRQRKRTKEARVLLKNDIFMKHFEDIIPTLSYASNKKDWNSYLGQRFEKMILLIFEDFRDPNPPFELDSIGNSRALCDCTCIFKNKKYAIEIKNRFGTGDGKIINKIYERANQIKMHRLYHPLFLIRAEDSNMTAINKWRRGGWIVLIGDEMYKFIKTNCRFDFKKYLERF